MDLEKLFFKLNMFIKIENLKLIFDKKNILSDINFSLSKNKITTLIGPNGGGKTSIAKIIVGITKPTSGKVIFNQKNIRIGYMPQKITLDNQIPITAKKFLELNQKNIFEQNNTIALINQLNLRNILDQQMNELSGGQMQKILFINSIANSPDLLILDEPTQFMDIDGTRDFYKILDDFRKNNQCAILLISHDLNFVMKKSDSVLCINQHICCIGSPESITNHPDYISIFGKYNNENEIGIYHHHHDHKHQIN
jgi:zinc transport system ATP-binding protein